MKSIARLATVGLAIVWFFVVAVNYYIVHKPFTLANALAMLNTLADLFVAGALVALAAALGRRVLRGFTFAAPLEALVFQTGVGLGIISFAVFALGLLGILQRGVFWLLLLLAFVLLRADVRAAWRDLRAIRLPAATRFERALAWFVGASLALALLTALTPTRAWDAQSHHLLVGKFALAAGRIAPPPDNPHLSHPALVEMLYLAAMSLKDDGAAPLMHLIFVGLIGGGLLAWSARHRLPRAGWSAVALLVAVPSFVTVAGWPYTDIALAGFAFLAFYAVTVGRDIGAARWLVLAGALAGFAAGCKYTALVIPAAMVLLVWRPTRAGWRDALIVAASAALTAWPWFVRNWVFVGNPIYPFLWGGPHWNEFRALHFAPPATFAPMRGLALVWDATILGTHGTLAFDATIGPLFLMLVPCLALVSPRARAVRDALIYAGIAFVFWLVLILVSSFGAQTRLVFFVFPVLAWLAAVALERLDALDRPQFSLARFSRLVVLLVLSLTLLTQWLDFAALDPLRYFAGMESRAEFLRARLAPRGFYQSLEFLETLPANSRVIFLWEPRDYYAPRAVSVQGDYVVDTFPNLRYLYRDADGIANALRQEGFTHILVSHWGLDFHLESGKTDVAQARLLQELLSRHARPVYGELPLELIEVAGKWRVQDAERAPYAVYALEP